MRAGKVAVLLAVLFTALSCKERPPPLAVVPSAQEGVIELRVRTAPNAKVTAAGASTFADATGEATLRVPAYELPAGAHPVEVLAEVDRSGEIVTATTRVTVDRPAIKPTLHTLTALDTGGYSDTSIPCRGELCPPLFSRPEHGAFRLLVEAPLGCEVEINGEKATPKPSTDVVWKGRMVAELKVDPRPRALTLPLPDALAEGTFALVLPGRVRCDGETLEAQLALGPAGIGWVLRAALEQVRNGALTFGDDDTAPAGAKRRTALILDNYGQATYLGPQGPARRVDVVALCDGVSLFAYDRRSGRRLLRDSCGLGNAASQVSPLVEKP